MICASLGVVQRSVLWDVQAEDRVLRPSAQGLCWQQGLVDILRCDPGKHVVLLGPGRSREGCTSEVHRNLVRMHPMEEIWILLLSSRP